ncbi:hypothetical protein BD311DRAFT_759860 [Dichomitus squalens]|uniref:Uncharacterized protein n=1 Tax=Dichomitus squalens TaxID=114155 RepID=A0A4V2K065_9APHY|nr:hypothetical protein BD311DRAFT_759860 [Dichomitus squalens]
MSLPARLGDETCGSLRSAWISTLGLAWASMMPGLRGLGKCILTASLTRPSFAICTLVVRYSRGRYQGYVDCFTVCTSS